MRVYVQIYLSLFFPNRAAGIKILLLSFLCLPAIAFATILHVGSGQTYTTIAAGIAATANGDTVYIHNGTYSENNLSVSAKTGVVIKGESMKGVIMNCTSTSRAFYINDGCDSIYFINFTIQNTSSSAISAGGSPAGQSHINFSNMTFQNCVSSTRGGAMDAYYFLKQWRIDTCFFYACSAKSGNGGAIYHNHSSTDTLTITNTVFENCYASGEAGALHEYGCCGPVTVGYNYRCKFINNYAGNKGGAIGNIDGNGGSWWTHGGSAASQCDFIGNTAGTDAQHLNFLLTGGQNAEYCFWDDGTAPANPADANFAITNYATAMLPMNYFPQYQYDTLTRSDPCSVFYSVGTSTSNLMTGTPTVSVSSGVATFSTAQTGNIGAGDMVTLDNGWVFYLKQKTSTTVWTVSAPIGASPNNISSRKVVFIKRAFNSLNAAISGSAPGSANSSHLNTMALTTAKTKLYISCYADGNDASMDTVSNTWTTSASYYITIYTPTNTLTECNQNQRHDGVISGGGYTLTNTVATDYKRNLDIGASYTKVIGLKIIRTSSNWSYGSCIGDYSTTGGVTNCEFAYNLLYQQSGGDYGCLIYNGNISATDHYAFSIHDNILISGSSTLLWGIYYGAAYQTTAARQSKIYNNTVYGSYTSSGGAIRIVVNNSASSSYLPLVKNNYAANTGTGSDYIFGGADYSNANAEFAYNGSDDGTCGSSNSNTTITVANMAFVSTTSGSENLHIQSSSTANTKGIGPCSDNQVAATDIDGDSRLTSCAADIGADENLAFTAPDTVVRYINTASAPGGTGITNATSGTDRAYHSLLEWDDAEDGNLVVNNQIKVAVCEGSDVDDSGVVDLNGWTTDYQHYIVIRTDSTAAYGQHGGKWNTGTYRLEANGSSGAMIVRTDYIKISGLQIRNTNTGSTPAALLLLDYDPANNCNKYEISKCILRGSCDRGIYVNDDDANVFISNTICYLDYVGNTWPVYASSGDSIVLFNCSFLGTYVYAHATNVATAIAKNTYGEHWYSYTKFSGNNNGTADANAPGTSGQTSKTATNQFVNVTAGSEDLHLKIGAAIIDQGTSLSGDGVYPITQDMESGTRVGGTWDIGADEVYATSAATDNPCAIYYSVGTSTADLKGNATTISITDGAATISGLTGGENIGVGDKITFNNHWAAYIKGKTSATQWTVCGPTGLRPTGISGLTVNNIKRAFNSLYAAMNGASPGAANASHLNSKALTTNDTRLYIACYADGDDASMTRVDYSWTTDATRHITIFTPTNTSTECNTSQRHNGVVNGGGYTLKSTDATTDVHNLAINASYTKVFGIKTVRTSSNWSDGYGIGHDYLTGNGACSCEVAYNLLYQESGGAGTLLKWDNLSDVDGYACHIYDNIVISNSSTLQNGLKLGNNTGGYQTTAARQCKIYNNTSYGQFLGGAIRMSILNSSGSLYMPLVRNNYAANTGTGTDYNLTGDYTNALSVFAYNASDDGTCGSSNSNTTITAAAMDFTSTTSGSEDLRIKVLSGAINSGVGPATDANVAASDLDNDARSGTTTDIGADKFPYTLSACGSSPCSVYYSVGTSTADFKGSATTISVTNGTATISGLTGSENIGAGDIVTFNTNYAVYLKKKNTATEWVVHGSKGLVPTGISNAVVTSIKRAFNSLNAAMNGASPGAANASHLNTMALTTSDKKLFIACYGDASDGSSVNVNTGWTADATRYITIFAPSNTSTECNQGQRHSGKWNTGKYLLVVTASYALKLDESYTVIDGLQMSNNNNDVFIVGAGTGNFTTKNCIIKGSGSSGNGMWFSTTGGNNTLYNNIVYDCPEIGVSVPGDATYNSHKVYNNTVYNCNTANGSNRSGIIVGGANTLVKNNIVMNTHLASGCFDIVVNNSAAQSYSVTSDATGAGTGSLASRTATANASPGIGNWVVFTNITGGSEDFHLQNVTENDANNAGIGPGSDGNVPSTDIDGQTRSGSAAEMGMDENLEYSVGTCATSPCSVCYSVGTSTADLKGSATTISITNGTATISGLTGSENIGVGDMITFSTSSVAYIRKKNSATEWLVTSANGLSPTGISSATVNSIKRTFNSLNLAVTGASPGAANAAHLNSKALTTNDKKLFIACYADGDDASMTRIDYSWTTDATRYITIYAPTNTSTECNTSQRHNGVVNGGGYTLKSTDASADVFNLDIHADYTKVFGIKAVRTSSNWTWGSGICQYYLTADGGRNCEVAYNLLYQESGGADGRLINWANISATNGYACYIHDNIMVSNSSTLNIGLNIKGEYQTDAGLQCKAYNNTVYGAYDVAGIIIDINNSSGSLYMPLVKNNYAACTGAGTDYNFANDYTNALNVFAYNASDDGTCGSSNGNITITVTNAAFISTTDPNQDLHIKGSSSLAGAGIGPTSDANVSTTDIDTNSRSGTTTDIGADKTYGTLTLSNHAAGHEINAFTYKGNETDAELFGFRLTPGVSSYNFVSQLVFSLTNIVGLADGDWGSVEICIDANNNGTVEAGESGTVGGSGVVSTAGGTITFSTGFFVSSATNYILRSDFSSLSPGDKVTIALYNSVITTASAKSGTCDSVTHWEVPWYDPGRPLLKLYTSTGSVNVQNIGPGATTSSYFSVNNDSLNQFFLMFDPQASTVEGMLTSFKTAASDTGSQVSSAYELLPSDKNHYNMFNIWRKQGSNQSWYANDVSAMPNGFTIAESTTTRMKYRINQRTVSLSGANLDAVSEITVYPTGHMFVYDSAYSSGDIDTFGVQFFMKKNADDGTLYATDNAGKPYGGIHSTGRGADSLHDFVAGYLGYRDSAGNTASPFSSSYSFDSASNGFRGIWITGTRTAWNTGAGKRPYQQAFMVDFSEDGANQNDLDDHMLDRQNPHVFDKYDFRKGWYDKNKKGDLNTDGFNESEGVYELYCLGDQVYFLFNHHTNKRKRFYSAFRMNNFAGSSAPTRVFLQHANNESIVDTLTSSAGEVNISLHDADNYVVFQINRVIRDSVLIFCGDPSSNLAVEMSRFWGDADESVCRLHWVTESESDNLGFNLYRREVERMGKGKSEGLSTNDSLYKRIADYSTLKGHLTSALRNDYTFFDHGVELGKTYEYCLESVDLYYTAQEYEKTVVLTVDKIFAFALEQNIPNPFNPNTLITYSVPGRYNEKKKCPVRLEIFDARGRLVKNLVTADKLPNQYVVEWNGKANNGRYVSSGVYFYRIKVDDIYKKTRTMAILK
ncbi:MAG: hypothetical protein A2324_14845 [Candidatus Raymondbacteria bacterium RIFOXYB2_FULL_49_35]|nr:MAG: hypothetical protein A2324_14845 [Candidatus Raymondbacteria bacterium RIFOXYB2_FULL_49_35]